MSLFSISQQEADQARTDAYAPPPAPPPPPLVDLGETVNSARRGLDEGFAGLARLGSTFANLPNNALDTPSLPGAVTQERTALSQWFENAATDLMARRANLMPTRQLSESQQIISGVVETLTPAILGGGAAGPAGAAIGLGAPAYERTRADLEAQGVDTATAQNAGVQDAVSMAALSAIPGAAGSRIWTRALTGAGFNVALGAGMRYNTERLLRERGYPELARQ